MPGILEGRRRPWFIGAALCAGGLGFAYILQYGFDLEPCPLCIFQRVAMLATGLAFLIAGFMGAQSLAGRWISCLLVWIGSGAGVFLGGRHVWLQSLPADQVPACGPPLEQLMAVLPLREAISFVLSGDGSCAEVAGRFLGLSLAGWTLAAFVLLSLWALASVALSRPLVRSALEKPQTGV